MEYDVRTDRGDAGVRTESTAAVGEIGIGTRFGSDSIVFGVDWMGLTYPLAKIDSKDSFPEDAVEAEGETNLEAVEKTAFKR